MIKKIIKTDLAPLAIGPYEQAINIGNLIYTSGQIPIDPMTNKMVEGHISEQTEQVIKNIKAILEAGGSSLNNIIKTTVYLKNMSDFGEMNRIYEGYFKNEKPARSCVEVSNLPKGADVEIEAIALVD